MEKKEIIIRSVESRPETVLVESIHGIVVEIPKELLFAPLSPGEKFEVTIEEGGRVTAVIVNNMGTLPPATPAPQPVTAAATEQPQNTDWKK